MHIARKHSKARSTTKVIHEVATAMGTDAVKHLIETAKQDIVRALK